MNDIQRQLIELKPGDSARINGRWVGATYQGWQIGCQVNCSICMQLGAELPTLFTGLPEAAAELAGGKATDVAA